MTYEERALQKVYDETTKEIERLEVRIVELTKKKQDLALKLLNTTKEPETVHLDKDGCLYWDTLIK